MSLIRKRYNFGGGGADLADITSDLLPRFDCTYDLGNETKRFLHVHTCKTWVTTDTGDLKTFHVQNPLGSDILNVDTLGNLVNFHDNKIQFHNDGSVLGDIVTIGNVISLGSGSSSGSGSVSVGSASGGGSSDSVSIGHNSSETTPGNQIIAIGKRAGNTSQGTSSIAIGFQAGDSNQSTLSIAIGTESGFTSQGTNSVAVGSSAGKTTQNNFTVAIGALAGNANQGLNSVSIGYQAGQTTQATNSVAIGFQAGLTTQALGSVAIGSKCGITNQSSYNVAIGYRAAETSQSNSSVAIGASAGETSQNTKSVAVGFEAGKTSQNLESIAIGYQAGTVNQADHNVAIGSRAGYSVQNAYSVAIGYKAGETSQFTSSIILNASGLALNSAASGFFVKPIRSYDNGPVYKPLEWNSSTGEIISNTNKDIEVTKLTFNNWNKNYIYANNNVDLWIFSNDKKVLFINGQGTDGQVLPGTPNLIPLGNSSFKWSAVWAVNGTIQTSDENQKESISISDLGSDFIMNLVPKKYKMKGDKKFSYGLMAQDIEKHLIASSKTLDDFSGVVKTIDPETQAVDYGLNYSAFIAPLIKTCQEQQALIANLDSRLKALEKK